MNNELIYNYLKFNNNNIDNKNYINDNNISIYFKDLLKDLLNEKPENAVDYITNYFKKIQNGNNINNKKFDYIINTLINRMNFIWYFSDKYNFLLQLPTLNSDDLYHSIQLVCYDFDESIIKLSKNIYESCLSIDKLSTLYNTLSILILYYPFLGDLITDCKIYIDEVKKNELDDNLSILLSSTIFTNIIKTVIQRLSNIDKPPFDVISLIPNDKCSLKTFLVKFVCNETNQSIIKRIREGNYGSKLQ